MLHKTMSLCLSCASVVQRVVDERSRLHQVIWDKCCDHMLAALHSVMLAGCPHAASFLYLLQWVNTTFFFDLLHHAQPEPHLLCPPLCSLRYKERTARFVLGFVSYAAPIRMLHNKHVANLASVQACCKKAFPDFLCISDFSMDIFVALNDAFFTKLLRVRRNNIPQNVVKWAEDDTRRHANGERYAMWMDKVQKQRAQVVSPRPASATCKVEDVHIVFLDDAKNLRD